MYGTEKNYEYLKSSINLFKLYTFQKNFVRAEALLPKVYQLAREILYGSKNSEYVLIMNNIAEYCLVKENRSALLSYVREAININAGAEFSVEPTEAWADSLLRTTFLMPVDFTETLSLLYLSYKLVPRSRIEQKIIAGLALDILQGLLADFSNEEDKELPLVKTNDWVHKFLAVTDLETEAAKAFILSERAKSVLLLQSAKTEQAYRFGSLPDSLAEKERDLQKMRSAYQAALFEKRPAHERDSFTHLLNDLNRTIKHFKDELERDYPQYADLKYRKRTAEPAAVQALLDDKTAVVEYVLSDTVSYVFYADRNQIKALALNLKLSDIEEQIGRLHKALSDYEAIGAQPELMYRQYAEAAHWCYSQLLAPALEHAPEGINHLIIVPDRELAQLPFEAFLTAPAPEGSAPYSKLDYLIKRYAISYNYSMGLWMQNVQATRRPNNGRMLGISSNYESQPDSVVLQYRIPADQRRRAGLSPLPSARNEVEGLSSRFAGSFLFDRAANERDFKNQASQYGVVHLAMHGVLDQRAPILSGLAFTEDGDTTENNFLQAYEISKMQLNADLVVLSACETGYGRFEVGNGTASLARAFMYAGVPALVVSLWEVNDASTATIMETFYTNLAAGQDKTQALRQAKLDYLSAAKGISAHPAFWSAFVQMGDQSPIRLQTKTSTGLWIGISAAALALLVLLFLLRRKKRAA